MPQKLKFALLYYRLNISGVALQFKKLVSRLNGTFSSSTKFQERGIWHKTPSRCSLLFILPSKNPNGQASINVPFCISNRIYLTDTVKGFWAIYCRQYTSIHNINFFSTWVLEKQKRIISMKPRYNLYLINNPESDSLSSIQISDCAMKSAHSVTVLNKKNAISIVS